MKKWLISFIAVSLLLVGCSNGEESVPTNTETIDVEALEVKVDILTPEEVEVKEPVELAAHVHQNGQNLDDASVKFEVWESGLRNNGQMIEGVLESDGVYKAEMTFEHDGVYYMFAHTTASNGMHVMPKQQIVAGAPDMDTVLPDDSTDSMDNGDHGDHSSEADGDHGEDHSSEEETEHNH